MTTLAKMKVTCIVGLFIFDSNAAEIDIKADALNLKMDQNESKEQWLEVVPAHCRGK